MVYVTDEIVVLKNVQHLLLQKIICNDSALKNLFMTSVACSTALFSCTFSVSKSQIIIKAYQVHNSHDVLDTL